MKKLLFILFVLISVSMNSQSIDLINPEKNVGITNWYIVNDDVMGGISKSYLSINEEKNLIFNGYLSLENNGGFASSRLSFNKETLTGIKSFKMMIKGDGNIYKLRLRQNNRRASYSCDFKSLKDKWIEIDISLEDFKPSWRGYTYSDYPDLEIEEINSMGIQISDKQEGDFKLEIKYIKAVY
jgi:monofunctional biosynthetic peptidoglycan transglycosylase